VIRSGSLTAKERLAIVDGDSHLRVEQGDELEATIPRDLPASPAEWTRVVLIISLEDARTLDTRAPTALPFFTTSLDGPPRLACAEHGINAGIAATNADR
jgi:hypothetical protein